MTQNLQNGMISDLKPIIVTFASFRTLIKMTTLMFFALPMLNSDQDMIELLKIKSGMEEINQSNRHEVQIPLHIRSTHPALNFLHFFQKWIKPVLAEFVATFILIFWACMLQPPVRKTQYPLDHEK